MASLRSLYRGNWILINSGSAVVRRCPAFDGDDSGSAAVNELVAAVSNALNGCPL